MVATLLLQFVTDEGTTRGDTLRFHSFISHLIEYIEVGKSLKGFLPNVRPSKVIAIFTGFSTHSWYILQIPNYGVSI